jgi:hypothetical protein
MAAAPKIPPTAAALNQIPVGLAAAAAVTIEVV